MVILIAIVKVCGKKPMFFQHLDKSKSICCSFATNWKETKPAFFQVVCAQISL
jgi:hypothetical protein